MTFKRIPHTKLTDFIDAGLKAYATAGDTIHVAVVSALMHVAEYGDAIYLNRVYAGLRSNDQQAVKNYIRRAHILIGLDGESPEGKDSSVIIAAATAGQVLDFAKGEFIVVKGHTSDQAKALLKLAGARLLNPDGKIDRKVLDRNNFAEVKVLNDEKYLEGILAAMDKAAKASDNVRNEVSNPVHDKIAKLRDQVQAIYEQAKAA